MNSRLKLINYCGLISLLFTACIKNSENNEATDPLDTPNKLEIGTMYHLDTNASVITWIGSSPARQHNGTIHISEGVISVVDSAILGGLVHIDVTSIDIKDIKKESEDYKKLKDHLLSDDFFFADTFPKATFELVSMRPYDSMRIIADKEEFESNNMPARLSEFVVKNPTHQLSGNLTIRGNTKAISFPIVVSHSGNRIFCEAKFNIDRTDWGINYGDEADVIDKLKDKFIYNTVNVGFSFQAVRVR